MACFPGPGPSVRHSPFANWSKALQFYLMVLLQIVSDEVILLVGGFERDGSPVTGAQDISETIFTYDCDRPDFPDETGITFNTAALTADPIQKVHAIGLVNSKKFSVTGCFVNTFYPT